MIASLPEVYIHEWARRKLFYRIPKDIRRNKDHAGFFSDIFDLFTQQTFLALLRYRDTFKLAVTKL